MARKDGKDRGILFRRGSWWVRWFQHGRERWEKCDSKSQARIRHGQHRANIREGKFFPEKFATKDITLAAWLARCVEGSTNISIGNERRYARRWTKWLGARFLTAITTEDLRHHQAKMRSKMKPSRPSKPARRQWADATVNDQPPLRLAPPRLHLGDQGRQAGPQSGVRRNVLSRAQQHALPERRGIDATAECHAHRQVGVGRLGDRNRIETNGTIFSSMEVGRSG